MRGNGRPGFAFTGRSEIDIGAGKCLVIDFATRLPYLPLNQKPTSMKTTGSIVLAWAILLSCSQSADQGALKSEIEKTNQEFMKAVSAKDADAVAQMYTENASLMFPNRAAIKGRENIKGFFEETMGTFSELKLTTEEVRGTDEFAVESGRYEMMADGKKIDEGKYLVEWRKVDGKWLLHRDMPSTDMPMPQAVAQPGEGAAVE